MLYKNIYKGKERLTYREIFDDKDISYGCKIPKGYKVVPNSSNQIMCAVKEIMGFINGDFDYEMKNLMIDNKEYFSCLGDDMLNYYLKTPIPRFDLKNI